MKAYKSLLLIAGLVVGSVNAQDVAAGEKKAAPKKVVTSKVVSVKTKAAPVKVVKKQAPKKAAKKKITKSKRTAKKKMKNAKKVIVKKVVKKQAAPKKIKLEKKDVLATKGVSSVKNTQKKCAEPCCAHHHEMPYEMPSEEEIKKAQAELEKLFAEMTKELEKEPAAQG